jgi:hypothetical protein
MIPDIPAINHGLGDERLAEALMSDGHRQKVTLLVPHMCLFGRYKTPAMQHRL